MFVLEHPESDYWHRLYDQNYVDTLFIMVCATCFTLNEEKSLWQQYEDNAPW